MRTTDARPPRRPVGRPGAVLRTLARGAALAGAILVTGCAAPSLAATELERIVEILQLAPGSTVADVGAGDGKWSVKLARKVGEAGHVWATEVDPDEVEGIEKRAADEKLHNLSVVLGSQSDTGLPGACCDAILLRMVYHHFTRPARMRAGLRRALRPRGLVAVVDIEPQGSWRELPGVPDRGGHGIPAADLISEMTQDGFELVSRHENWNGDRERYCVVFRR